MNLTDLGPPIPTTMTRLPAFHLERWSLITTPNDAGEICLTFHGHAPGYDVDVVLLLACHAQTGDPIRCVAVHPVDLEHEMIPLPWIPGIVEDIARSAVLDTFHQRSHAPWVGVP